MELLGTRNGPAQNARRDDRVPLDAVVALSFDDGSDILEADALDVSPNGLSLRANFVPDIGTRLTLRFHCPPHDEPVRALGEVVWGTWQGRDEGLFGMEFLELDTKSATAIRRLLSPGLPATEPERPQPRIASMRIDGLEVPVEAEVKRADPGCIVLEQDLTFLRLGRGVEVDVKGRGKARGRIASIELRHGPLDVPTLVFGVLLDGAQEAAAKEPMRAQRAARPPTAMLDAPFAVHAPALDERDLDTSRDADGAGFDEPADVEPPADDAYAHHALAARARAVHARAAAGDAPDPDDTEEACAAAEALPELHGPEDHEGGELSLRPPLAARLRGAMAGWALRVRHLYAGYRARPAAGESPFVRAARVTGRVSASLQRLLQRKPAAPKRRTTGAPARAARSAAQVKPAARVAAEAKRPRNHRLIALALAIVGVSVGVYALAPRSGADRIRAGRYAAEATPASAPASAPVPEVSARLAEPAPEPLATAPSAPAPVAEPSTQPATFGEAAIDNGRTFVLRMSGPVRQLEGDARPDGFTVRVPGRLALDRASPIAASHRGVARAMVLNRGEYAELTVDFLPGMRPKYQVVGKDAALEITLEKP